MGWKERRFPPSCVYTFLFQLAFFKKKKKRREKRIGAYSFFRGLPPPPSFSLQGPSFPCNSVETKKNRLNFRTKKEASNCLLGRGGGGWIQWPLLPPEEKGATGELTWVEFPTPFSLRIFEIPYLSLMLTFVWKCPTLHWAEKSAPSVVRKRDTRCCNFLGGNFIVFDREGGILYYSSCTCSQNLYSNIKL